MPVCLDTLPMHFVSSAIKRIHHYDTADSQPMLFKLLWEFCDDDDNTLCVRCVFTLFISDIFDGVYFIVQIVSKHHRHKLCIE